MELAAVHGQSTRQAHQPESSYPQQAAPAAEHRYSDDRSGPRADDDDMLLDEHRYSHPGEILIARELLEQQKREEELRRYWHEMGFELNDDDSDNDDNFQRRHDDEVRVVSHEQHQNVEHDPAQKSVKHSVNSSAGHKKDIDTKPSHTYAADVTETDKSSLCIVKVHVPAAAAAVHAQCLEMESHATECTPGRASKNDDDDCTRMTVFEPQSERSLEREVREAREREQALRHARGLTTASHDDARQSATVQREVVQPLQSVNDPVLARRPLDYQTFTKRYAENRLKAELQRDRQRELDLRGSGIIYSISEERAGDRLKFVEVLPSEPPPATKHRPASRNVPPVAAHPVVLERRSEPPGSSEHADVQTDEVATTATLGADKPLSVVGDVPPVRRTYAYPYFNTASVDTLPMSPRVSPETRIEKEIAEFRKRENELRLFKP